MKKYKVRNNDVVVFHECANTLIMFFQEENIFEFEVIIGINVCYGRKDIKTASSPWCFPAGVPKVYFLHHFTTTGILQRAHILHHKTK